MYSDLKWFIVEEEYSLVCVYIMTANLQFYSDLDKIIHNWPSECEEGHCLHKISKADLKKFNVNFQHNDSNKM